MMRRAPASSLRRWQGFSSQRIYADLAYSVSMMLAPRPSFLLRLLLIATLVLNGAASAYASISMRAASDGAPVEQVADVMQSDEDCGAHHNPSPRAEDAAPTQERGGHAGHAGPDCCKSSACRCACVHACVGALPVDFHLAVQPALGLHVMPLSVGHAAPALPHLIRPPIG